MFQHDVNLILLRRKIELKPNALSPAATSSRGWFSNMADMYPRVSHLCRPWEALIRISHLFRWYCIIMCTCNFVFTANDEACTMHLLFIRHPRFKPEFYAARLVQILLTVPSTIFKRRHKKPMFRWRGVRLIVTFIGYFVCLGHSHSQCNWGYERRCILGLQIRLPTWGSLCAEISTRLANGRWLCHGLLSHAKPSAFKQSLAPQHGWHLQPEIEHATPSSAG